MLVFEATEEFQGVRPNDYHWATTGELVHLPIVQCDDAESCGCGRGFCGFDSHRATTTARVVDRPGYDVAQLSKELAVSLCDGGWISRPDSGDELVSELAAQIVELANRCAPDGEPGCVIELDGEKVGLRSDATTMDAIDRVRRTDPFDT